MSDRPPLFDLPRFTYFTYYYISPQVTVVPKLCPVSGQSYLIFAEEAEAEHIATCPYCRNMTSYGGHLG